MTSTPLLSFPFKYSTEVDLVKAIRKYGDENFRQDDSESHPDSLMADARKLHELRKQATIAPGTPSASVNASTVLSKLILYDAQIVYMLTKFPTDIHADFAWFALFASPPGTSKDAAGLVSDYLLPGTLPTQLPIQFSDLVYERCCVLINIAAAYAKLATMEDRTQAEGMKQAIANLQIAAGVLLYLCDKILPDLRPPAGSPEPFSPDFSQHTLRALAKFCLAQAQECYFQRAVTDHKSNSVISKIAAKVGAYYAEALEQAQTAKSAGGAWPTWAFPADWINHVTYRKWHFTAAAQYRKSLDDSASNKYGEELGRLHLAQKHVRTALDSPKKGIAQGVIIDIKSLHATLTDLITRAERDNRLIYHETVTSESSLPAILPADMVKATLPQEIEHPIARLHTGKGGLGQRPLFENVIPYAVHAAIALYEHRKETFLKEEIIQKKDQLDHTATRTLQKLNLPGALQAIEAPLGVPASLLRKAEDLRRDGGTKKLRTLSQDALSTASTNQQVLKDVKDLLQQEETEDSQLRTHFGKDKWNRQTSAALNSLLKGKMVKFEDTLNKAGKSDHLVRDKLAECEGTLRLLEGPAAAIEASIPRSGRDGSKYDDMSESASQGTLVQKLQAHLENLDDLIAARRRLVEDVQRTVTSDSIRASVMQMASELSAQSGEQLSTAQFEDVLQEEFTKYAFYADTLAGNQRRQEDLLSTAKQTNQQFLSARKSDATTKERERVLQQYDNAIVKYHELSANLTEALQFYQNFAKLLDQLRQNVKEWVHARRVEAQDLLNVINMGDTTLDDEDEELEEDPAFTQPNPQQTTASSSAPSQPSTPAAIRAQQPGKWQPGMPIKFG